jgi:hypothetical protein
MSVPTQGEAYSKLMEYLRLAQEEAATLAHLANANDDRKLALSWLAVSENFKKMQHSITTLATRGLQ